MWVHLSVGSKVHEGLVKCGVGDSRGQGPRRPVPWTKSLDIGTWNVTLLGEKKPKLVQKLPTRDSWAHHAKCGTQLLEKG